MGLPVAYVQQLADFLFKLGELSSADRAEAYCCSARRCQIEFSLQRELGRRHAK